jgi:hypothetical protein
MKKTIINIGVLLIALTFSSCSSKENSFDYIAEIYTRYQKDPSKENRLKLTKKYDSEVMLTNLIVDRWDISENEEIPTLEEDGAIGNERKKSICSIHVKPFKINDKGKKIILNSFYEDYAEKAGAFIKSDGEGSSANNINARVKLYVPAELKEKLKGIYPKVRIAKEVFGGGDLMFATTEISVRAKLTRISTVAAYLSDDAPSELLFNFEVLDILEKKPIESASRKAFEEYYELDLAKWQGGFPGDPTFSPIYNIHDVAFEHDLKPTTYLKQKKPITGTLGKYTGEIMYGKPNGKGKLGRCEGEWKDGLKHGHIVWPLSDGGRFEGEYVAGNPVSGELTYGQGFIKSYTGQFSKGYVDDHTYDHGDIYDLYDDEFSKTEFFAKNGNGKEVYADSSYYDGEWANNMKVKGMYVWPDGQKYEGEFVNNNIGGKGKLTAPDGKLIWEK